jgi:hypothetical protein
MAAISKQASNAKHNAARGLRPGFRAHLYRADEVRVFPGFVPIRLREGPVVGVDDDETGAGWVDGLDRSCKRAPRVAEGQQVGFHQLVTERLLAIACRTGNDAGV